MRRLSAVLLTALGTFLTAAAVLAPTSQAQTVGVIDRSALEVHQGTIEVHEDGTVIENLEIRGTLRIEAENVVVRNVWIYTAAPWTLYVASGSATIENVEIGNPDVIGERGIGGSNITVRNADIHHVEDGIKLGSNATFDNVWVHDLASTGDSPHADAVQVEGTAKNSSVRNSVLSSVGSVGLGNAAVFIKSDLGEQSDLTFENNTLDGGNYTVYMREGKNGVPTNVSFIGNRFGPNRQYGLMVADGPFEWEENRWESTGELIDPKGNVIGPPPATTTTVAPPSTTTTTVTPMTTTTTPATTTTAAGSTAAGPTDPPTGTTGTGNGWRIAVLAAASLVMGIVVMATLRSRRSPGS